MVSATVITAIASLAAGYFIGKYTSKQVRFIGNKEAFKAKKLKIKFEKWESGRDQYFGQQKETHARRRRGTRRFRRFGCSS